MRTIKVKFADDQKHVFITDWNFKTWTLSANTDQKYECSEMKGCEFISVTNFVTQMYGSPSIYPEWNRYDVFVNYEAKVE
jgi:hypothetical protein